jgi:surface carbohydrate biosynthesis protein
MYELEARELRSSFYAATRIAQFVPKIVIFQHSELYRIAIFSRPGDVLIKSASYTFSTALKLMKVRGFQIIQVQEEGIHMGSNSEVPLTMSREANLQCHRYLAWHKNDARVALTAGFNANQVDIVGNMRFEYLRHRQLSRSLNVKGKLRILILTNFDFTNVIYRTPKRGTPIENEEISKLVESIALQKDLGHANQKLYLEFLRNSRLNHFDVKVRKYFYERREFSVGSPQISIDANLNFFDSLDAADVVLHYGSTGGLEGIFLGLPSIVLTSDPSKLNPGIGASSSIHTDVEELFAELNQFDRDRSRLLSVSSSQIECSNGFYGFRLEDSCQIQKLIDLASDDYWVQTNPLGYFVVFRAVKFFIKSRLRLVLQRVQRSQSIRKASPLTIEQVDFHLDVLGSKNEFVYRIHRSRKQLELQKRSSLLI